MLMNSRVVQTMKVIAQKVLIGWMTLLLTDFLICTPLAPLV